jgi:antitoxin (DNA-binding transcriptional repressor) of toxin-antitoxin stability system
MAIIQLTAREFRDKQASVFACADKGERVIIRRKGKKAYTLVPVEEDDLIISPALQAKIETARKELKKGETLHFDNVDDAISWMDSL